MAPSIKNTETDRLAHELARATGESVTRAATNAIKLRLEMVKPRSDATRLTQDVRQIQQLVASLPDRDLRSADEIIGYDEFGMPA
ncbi:MAG: type II toxin-antitoxin system VapB family antitoxin [Gemmatimonadaceae bacterium]